MRRALCPGLPDLSQAYTHLPKLFKKPNANAIRPVFRRLNAAGWCRADYFLICRALP
jgi:hypothetical protein